jgi:hypothetical protein
MRPSSTSVRVVDVAMAATLTTEDGTVLERPPNKLLIVALKVAGVVIAVLILKTCLGG